MVALFFIYNVVVQEFSSSGVQTILMNMNK